MSCRSTSGRHGCLRLNSSPSRLRSRRDSLTVGGCRSSALRWIRQTCLVRRGARGVVAVCTAVARTCAASSRLAGSSSSSSSISSSSGSSSSSGDLRSRLSMYRWSRQGGRILSRPRGHRRPICPSASTTIFRTTSGTQSAHVAAAAAHPPSLTYCELHNN